MRKSKGRQDPIAKTTFWLHIELAQIKISAYRGI